jgi:hypothetical protein
MYQTGTDQIRKTTSAIVPGYVPPGTLQLLDHGRTPKPDSRHGHRAPIWSAGITITSYPAKYSGTTAAHPGQLNPPDFTSEIHANRALTTIATATAPTCQPP